MPLRQQDIFSGKDTKLLRVELNKQNKEKAHLHHSSPRNDTDVLILLIIFYALKCAIIGKISLFGEETGIEWT